MDQGNAGKLDVIARRSRLLRDALRETKRRDGLPREAPCDALFVLPRGTFNVQSRSGLISDKSELVRQAIVARGCLARSIELPYRLPDSPKHQQRVFGVEGLSLRCFAQQQLDNFSLSSRGMKRPPSAPGKTTSATKEHVVKLWSAVLDRTKPRAIFGINLPDALCAQASIRGIHTVELMHGLFGEWFPEMLNCRRVAERPTHMFIWDRSYRDLVMAADVVPISTGYPLLEFEPELLPPKRASDKQPTTTVLVPTAYAIADSIDPYGILEPSINVAIRSLEASNRDYRFQFRLHPTYAHHSQSDAPAQWLRQRFPGAGVTDPRDKYILDELKQVDAVLAYPSSLVFEAAMQAVPSVIVTREGSGDSSKEASPFLGNYADMFVPHAIMESGLCRIVDGEEVVTAMAEAVSMDYDPYAPTTDRSLTEALAELGL